MNPGRHRGDSLSSLPPWDQAVLTQSIDFADRRGSTASSSSFDSWATSISFESPTTPNGSQNLTATGFNGYKSPGDSFEVVQDANQMDLYGQEMSDFESYGSTLAQSWLSLPSSLVVGHSHIHTAGPLKPSPLPDVYKTQDQEAQAYHANFTIIGDRQHPTPIIRSCGTPPPPQKIMPPSLLTPSSYAESSDGSWQMDMDQDGNDNFIHIKPEYDNLVMPILPLGHEQVSSAAAYLWAPDHMDHEEGLEQELTVSPDDMLRYQHEHEDHLERPSEIGLSSLYCTSPSLKRTRRQRRTNSPASDQQRRCQNRDSKVGKMRRSSTAASSAVHQRKARSPAKLDRKQHKKSKAAEDALAKGEICRVIKRPKESNICNGILMSSKIEVGNEQHVRIGEYWVCLQPFERHEHLNRHLISEKHRDPTLDTRCGKPYRVMQEDGTVIQPPHPCDEDDENEGEAVRNSHGYDSNSSGIEEGDVSRVNTGTDATDCAIDSSFTSASSADTKRVKRFELVWCPFTDCPKNDLFNERDPKRGKGCFGGLRWDNLYAHMKKTHFTRTGREDDDDIERIEYNGRTKRMRNSLERNNRKTRGEACDVGYEWLFLQARADKMAENMAREAKATKQAQTLAQTQRHGSGPNLLARRKQIKSESFGSDRVTAGLVKSSTCDADSGQAWSANAHDWIVAATNVADAENLAALTAARDMYVSKECCWSESYIRGHKLLKEELPGLADFLRDSGCCIAPDEAGGKGKRAANRAEAAAARANKKMLLR